MYSVEESCERNTVFASTGAIDEKNDRTISHEFNSSRNENDSQKLITVSKQPFLCYICFICIKNMNAAHHRQLHPTARFSHVPNAIIKMHIISLLLHKTLPLTIIRPVSSGTPRLCNNDLRNQTLTPSSTTTSFGIIPDQILGWKRIFLLFACCIPPRE